MSVKDQTGNTADANVPPADAVTNDQNQTKNDGFVSRADFDREISKLVSERDAFKSEVREYKSKTSVAERTAAEKAGDVEALRASFTKELKDVQTELDTWKSRFHEKALKSVALSELAKVSNDPEVAYLLLEKNLELAENGGDFVPRVKDSTLSISDWAEKKLTEMQKPHLLKSKRVPGTGDQSRDNSSGGTAVEATETPAGFSGWSKKDQSDFFSKNPKLGAKLAASFLRG